jgi:putative lipoic acid-binding regulatory protein
MNKNSETNDPEKIKYPITYPLKLIMDNSIANEINIKNVSDKLDSLKIKYGTFSSRLSKQGKYVSLSVNVRISSEDLFKKLYHELQTVEGLKTAI